MYYSLIHSLLCYHQLLWDEMLKCQEGHVSTKKGMCWVLGAGCWVLGAGCWVLGTAGCWVMLGTGYCWVLGTAGCWVLGTG